MSEIAFGEPSHEVERAEVQPASNETMRRKMDLNLMVALHALLVEVNITRAAERTMVGQPAMSASLARLRGHFNDPLLVRDGRRMRLTPLAASLLGPVGNALDSVYAVLDTTLPFDPQLLKRTFSVVASDYMSMILLKPFLQAVIVEAPQIRLNIIAPRDGLVPLLRGTRCDLLLAPGVLVPKELQSYQHRELFTDEFVGVVDKDNVSVGDSITMEQLQLLDLPGLSEALVMEESTDEPYVVRTGEVRDTPHFAVKMHMVRRGPFVAVAQARMMTLFGSRAGLRSVRIDADLPILKQSMYWDQKYVADPAHNWLRDRLATVAAAL